MRIIPTYVHGFLDYIGAVILFFTPEIFGFSGIGGPAEVVPRTVGVLILLQSVLTDYELGAFSLISMRTHLINDYIASIFLAVSPWIFGFQAGPVNQWVPHVVLGALILGVSVMTEKNPRREISPRLYSVDEHNREAKAEAEHRKAGNF